MRKAVRIVGTAVLWVVSVFVALVMGMMGSAKVVGQSPWPRFFSEFGYPDWFLLVVGLSQVAGAVLLLIPRTARYGAGLLALVMAGAFVTELTREGGFPSPVTAFVYFTILSGIFTVRHFQARRRETVQDHSRSDGSPGVGAHRAAGTRS